MLKYQASILSGVDLIAENSYRHFSVDGDDDFDEGYIFIGKCLLYETLRNECYKVMIYP